MVKSGQVWDGIFPAKDATGALATPSVGPAGALYVAGTVNGATVTITGSNPYKWSVTLPTLTAGQSVSMYITATIGGIATAQVVAEDVGDTSLPSDLATTIGAAGAGLSAVPWNAAWDAEVQSEVADALAATDAITAATLSATAIAKIADAVLRRTAANIEASANGDTLSVESLYGVIMASFEAALSGTTLTVRKSDGTTLGTKTVTVDSAADPITGIT